MAYPDSEHPTGLLISAMVLSFIVASSLSVYPLGQYSDEKYLLSYTEPTEPGKFIVFPPTIRHRAWPNTSEEDRITIAANWFPTGNLNAAGVSHLRLDVIQ